MKFSIQCVQSCLLLQSISAFAPLHSARKQDHLTPLSASRKDDSAVNNGLHAIGVGAVIFAASITNPVPAIASSPVGLVEQSYDHAIFSSSSQLLSETIKTMDFSLPSSYDSISDAKGATEELVQEENIITGTKVKKAAKKSSSSSSDGFSLGGNQLTPEEKAQLAAERQAAREAAQAQKEAEKAEKEAEKAAIQAEKEAEKALFAAQKQAERDAAAAEKAEKNAAAKAAKEKSAEAAEAKAAAKAAAAKSSQYEIVDFGLPSYDSATATKERSAFSL